MVQMLGMQKHQHRKHQKTSKSIKQHRNIPYCVKTVFGLDAHYWMNHTHLAHLSLMGCMLSRSVGEVLQESGEMLCGTQVGSSRALRDPSFLLPCARWRLVEQRHLHLWSFMHHSNFDWIKTQARQFASPSWCRGQLGGFAFNSPPTAISLGWLFITQVFEGHMIHMIHMRTETDKAKLYDNFHHFLSFECPSECSCLYSVCI